MRWRSMRTWAGSSLVGLPCVIDWKGLTLLPLRAAEGYGEVGRLRSYVDSQPLPEYA
jgi:hypothetical protein